MSFTTECMVENFICGQTKQLLISNTTSYDANHIQIVLLHKTSLATLQDFPFYHLDGYNRAALLTISVRNNSTFLQ